MDYFYVLEDIYIMILRYFGLRYFGPRW